MLRFLITVLIVLSATAVQAQRVYAPEITGKSDVIVENEELVYILRPKSIKELHVTETQAHIQLNDRDREYFYTLTLLNKGKKLTIKTVNGETIQTGIIRKEIDSGVIISRLIKERGNLLRFARRIKQEKQPIIVPRKIIRLAPSPEELKKEKYRKRSEDMAKELAEMRKLLIEESEDESQFVEVIEVDDTDN